MAVRAVVLFAEIPVLAIGVQLRVVGDLSGRVVPHAVAEHAVLFVGVVADRDVQRAAETFLRRDVVRARHRRELFARVRASLRAELGRVVIDEHTLDDGVFAPVVAGCRDAVGSVHGKRCRLDDFPLAGRLVQLAAVAIRRVARNRNSRPHADVVEADDAVADVLERVARDDDFAVVTGTLVSTLALNGNGIVSGLGERGVLDGDAFHLHRVDALGASLECAALDHEVLHIAVVVFIVVADGLVAISRRTEVECAVLEREAIVDCRGLEGVDIRLCLEGQALERDVLQDRAFEVAAPLRDPRSRIPHIVVDGSRTCVDVRTAIGFKVLDGHTLIRREGDVLNRPLVVARLRPSRLVLVGDEVRIRQRLAGVAAMAVDRLAPVVLRGAAQDERIVDRLREVDRLAVNRTIRAVQHILRLRRRDVHHLAVHVGGRRKRLRLARGRIAERARIDRQQLCDARFERALGGRRSRVHLRRVHRLAAVVARLLRLDVRRRVDNLQFNVVRCLARPAVAKEDVAVRADRVRKRAARHLGRLRARPTVDETKRRGELLPVAGVAAVRERAVLDRDRLRAVRLVVDVERNLAAREGAVHRLDRAVRVRVDGGRFREEVAVRERDVVNARRARDVDALDIPLRGLAVAVGQVDRHLVGRVTLAPHAEVVQFVGRDRDVRRKICAVRRLCARRAAERVGVDLQVAFAARDEGVVAVDREVVRDVSVGHFADIRARTADHRDRARIRLVRRRQRFRQRLHVATLRTRRPVDRRCRVPGVFVQERERVVLGGERRERLCEGCVLRVADLRDKGIVRVERTRAAVRNELAQIGLVVRIERNRRVELAQDRAAVRRRVAREVERRVRVVARRGDLDEAARPDLVIGSRIRHIDVLEGVAADRHRADLDSRTHHAHHNRRAAVLERAARDGNLRAANVLHRVAVVDVLERAVLDRARARAVEARQHDLVEGAALERDVARVHQEDLAGGRLFGGERTLPAAVLADGEGGRLVDERDVLHVHGMALALEQLELRQAAVHALRRIGRRGDIADRAFVSLPPLIVAAAHRRPFHGQLAVLRTRVLAAVEGVARIRQRLGEGSEIDAVQRGCHRPGKLIFRRVLHALRRVDGRGNRVVRRIGQLEVVGRKLLVVRLCVVIDEIARARHRIAGDGDLGNHTERQQLLVKRDGVAARQFKRVANDVRLGEAAQLDAGTARVRHRDLVPLDGRMDVRVVYINTTCKASNLIILNDKVVTALALGEDGVGVRITGVIRTVEDAVVDAVRHLTLVLEVVVDVQAATERTVLDLHLGGGDFVLRVAFRRPRSGRTNRRGGRRSEFDIVDGQLAGGREHACVAARDVGLDVTIRQLRLTVCPVYTDDAVARAGNLVVAANRAVNLVAARLQGREASQRTMDVKPHLAHGAGPSGILVERSGVVRHVQVLLLLPLLPRYTEQGHVGFVRGLAGLVLLLCVQGLGCHNVFIRHIVAEDEFKRHIVDKFCLLDHAVDRVAVGIGRRLDREAVGAVVGRDLGGEHTARDVELGLGRFRFPVRRNCETPRNLRAVRGNRHLLIVRRSFDVLLEKTLRATRNGNFRKFDRCRLGNHNGGLLRQPAECRPLHFHGRCRCRRPLRVHLHAARTGEHPTVHLNRAPVDPQVVEPRRSILERAVRVDGLTVLVIARSIGERAVFVGDRVFRRARVAEPRREVVRAVAVVTAVFRVRLAQFQVPETDIDVVLLVRQNREITRDADLGVFRLTDKGDLLHVRKTALQHLDPTRCGNFCLTTDLIRDNAVNRFSRSNRGLQRLVACPVHRGDGRRLCPKYREREQKHRPSRGLRE